jgi:DNA helicase-2/ATP-dependent DNA helicase PcrA
MTGFKERIVDWLVSNFRSIVIDEVYDGDALDLAVAFEAANMGLPVTLIGDPWQAIYRWRGATPELVDRLTASTSDPFVVYALTRSFRFEGAQMPALAADLRNGSPVDLPPISSLDVDVALARRWRDLWQVGDNVLPLAFRTVENATDAAINLLLDEVTRSRLGLNSFGRDGAIAKLKLDRESFLLVQSGLMQPLLDDLVSGVDAASVLEALRDAIRTLGVRRPGRLPTPAKEAILVQQVRLLSQRLFRDDLIAGLTVFQAKGREWPRVGVALSSSQQAMLLAGLREPAEDQCIIYVALTRARRRCGHLASTAQQAGDTPAVAARVSAATSRS